MIKVKNKKILGIILVISLLLSKVTNVYAQTIAINNDFITEFKNSSVISGLNEVGNQIDAQIDTENKKIRITQQTSEIVLVNYNETEKYIEIDNSSVNVTDQNITKIQMTDNVVKGFIEAIIKLSGHENKKINFEIDYDAYDTYGIKLTSKGYEINGSNAVGPYSSVGTYFNYFKMSLDTEKINALMTTYDKDKVLTLKPTLKANEITNKSVSLTPHIEYTSSNPDFVVYCYIYRSTSENGTYEKLSKVNCLDSTMSLVDVSLNSNSTYWYKASVEEGTIFSDPIKVTTQANSSNTTKEEIENPKTGASISTIPIILLLVVSVIAYTIAKKISIIQKI